MLPMIRHCMQPKFKMGLLSWIFGKHLTPRMLVRRNQRAINKAVRDIDRERFQMEQQEKKLITDIKKTAAAGQMDAVKIIARDLVRTRRYIKRFMLMKANLQAVSVKMITLQSQSAIGEALAGVTGALQEMNKQLCLPKLQKILQEFEKQTEVMNLKEEITNESVDDALGEEDQDTESDDLVAQIYDELGLQLQDQFPELPGGNRSITAKEQAQEEQSLTATPTTANGSSIDDDIQARLDNLRRR